MKLYYKRNDNIYYTIEGWEIEKTGGFIMARQWHARNLEKNLYFWQTTKKCVEIVLNEIEKGKTLSDIFGKYYKLYTSALY